MTTNNPLNQRSEAFVIAPTGVGTPNAADRLLLVQKDQATVADTSGYTAIQLTNNNSAGSCMIQASTDNGGGATGFAGGVQQNGSAFSDGESSVGYTMFYSNAASQGLTVYSQNGPMDLSVKVSTVKTNYVTLDPTNGGKYRGQKVNTAPAAGFIGELITANNTGVALTNNTIANITSISLTAGIWDVSSYVEFVTTGTVAGTTQWVAAISTANNNLTGVGENGVTQDGGKIPVNGINNVSVWTGPTRISLSATTTHYLNCRPFAGTTFTNVTSYGVIRAVRVA